MLPMYVILYYDYKSSSKQTMVQAGAQLQTEAQSAATNIDRGIRGAAVLLNSFGMIPQLRGLYTTETNPCDTLSRLLTVDSRYSSGYVVKPDGLIDCFSSPVLARGNESSQEYFRRAMTSGKVEVGLPTICNSSGMFCFPMALALRNAYGNVTSVLVLDLDPVWFSKQVETSWSMPQTSMKWLDSKGHIVFAWPELTRWLSKSSPNNQVGAKIIQESTGHFIEKDNDGVHKVFGYSTIRGIGYPNLYLSLSVPSDSFLVPIQLKLERELKFLTVVMLLLIASTWILGWFVNRRFTAINKKLFLLIDKTDSQAYPKIIYTEKDKHRKFSEMIYSKNAFEMLTNSIDSIITKLQLSKSRLNMIVNKLSEGVSLCKLDSKLLSLRPTQNNNDTWLQTTLENLPDGVSLCDLDGHLLYCNQAVVNILGFGCVSDYHRSQFELADILELTSLDGTMCPEKEWALARILRGESLSGLKMRIWNKRTNSRNTVNFCGTLVNDTSGKPLMAVVVMCAITQESMGKGKAALVPEFS
jgi:PAS domain-containing protein